MSAVGFLKTYYYLIQHESDFEIARNETRLLPPDITWTDFCAFSKDFIDISDDTVSERYHYGKLRLTRLNLYAKLFIGKFQYERVHGKYGAFFARFYDLERYAGRAWCGNVDECPMAIFLVCVSVVCKCHAGVYPISWRAVRLGILGSFTPPKDHLSRASFLLLFHLPPILPTTMPRKRVSDDIDHVPIDPKPSRIPKKKPPPPPSPPKHVPILINNPLLHGHSQIPEHIKLDDVYSIFCLFFSDEILFNICQNTNQYAEFYPSKDDKLYARKWYPTTVSELRAYLGAWIWMGVFPSSEVEDFWNSSPRKGPVHKQLREAISLKRWQQIDRFFHISSPQDPSTLDVVVGLPSQQFLALSPSADVEGRCYCWTASTSSTDAGPYPPDR